MPVATPPADRSSRTLRAVMLAFVAGAVLVTGCSSSMRQPTDYGEVNAEGTGFYGNFMYGCTGVQPVDGKYKNPELNSESYCKCLFEGLKDKVPFDEVRDFEEKQAAADEGNEPEVPKGIEAVRRDCAKEKQPT